MGVLSLLDGLVQTIYTLLQTVQTQLTFQLQAYALLDQANPVQNTYYTILDTTLNVRLHFIVIDVETANETLQVRLTIDGQTLLGSLACTFATAYYVYLDDTVAGTALLISANQISPGYSGDIQARSVKVEVRKTTAAGAGNLKGKVIFAKR